MNDNERAALVEELAAIEHQRWADWQAWCHKVLRENCPSPELESILERWDRQIATPYAELSEREKQSDRDQVERYMPIIDRLRAIPTVTVEDRDALVAEIERVFGSFVNEDFFPELSQLRHRLLTDRAATAAEPESAAARGATDV